MKNNITSAIALSIACFAASVLLSGAPLRVHVVDALSLLIAFTIPAAHIAKTNDIKIKLKQIIVFWLSGTLVWFFATTLVVVKAEVELYRLALLLPSSFIGLIVFLSLHILILKAIKRHKNTKGGAEQSFST